MISTQTGCTVSFGNTEAASVISELDKLRKAMLDRRFQQEFPKLNEFLSHLTQHVKAVNYGVQVNK